MDEPLSEERIAAMLRMLPPPPRGWIEAAQELPAARRAIDGLVERAQADERYRRALVADLEAALARTGVEPTPQRLELLRRALDERP